MNAIWRGLASLYRLMLTWYPHDFRAEFGEEMQATFDQAARERYRSGGLAAFLLREMRDLPRASLGQYEPHWLAGGLMNTQNVSAPSSRGEALLGTLPFLIFGLVSMLSKQNFNFHDGYFWLGAYGLILVGLLIGWAKNFPRWAFSYVGWALVFAWWWSSMSTAGLRIFGYTFMPRETWGWRIWLPLGVVILAALLWRRSLKPIREFFVGIWNDWVRLSFATFTFPAWFSLLYDENHHPELLLFMLGTTLALSAAAYLYQRSASVSQQILALIGGLAVSAVMGGVSEATWDWRAYYGMPATTQVTWVMVVFRMIIALVCMSVFLFGPALIALLRKALLPRTVNP